MVKFAKLTSQEVPEHWEMVGIEGDFKTPISVSNF